MFIIQIKAFVKFVLHVTLDWMTNGITQSSKILYSIQYGLEDFNDTWSIFSHLNIYSYCGLGNGTVFLGSLPYWNSMYYI